MDRLGPEHKRQGDIVVVCDGGQMSLILRPADDGKEQYHLVGQRFIYSNAEGQVYDALEKKSVKKRMFKLV